MALNVPLVMQTRHKLRRPPAFNRVRRMSMPSCPVTEVKLTHYPNQSVSYTVRKRIWISALKCICNGTVYVLLLFSYTWYSNLYINCMVQKLNLSQCICSNREGLSLYAEIHLIFGIVHSALLLLLTRIFHESNPPWTHEKQAKIVLYFVYILWEIRPRTKIIRVVYIYTPQRQTP